MAKSKGDRIIIHLAEHGGPGVPVHDAEEPPERLRPDGTEEVSPRPAQARPLPGDAVDPWHEHDAAARDCARRRGGQAGEPHARRAKTSRGRRRPASVAGIARARTPKRRRNPFGFLARLRARASSRDVISELRKVTWPTFAETRYLTVVVAIVARRRWASSSAAVDLVFGWIIEKLFF